MWSAVLIPMQALSAKIWVCIKFWEDFATCQSSQSCVYCWKWVVLSFDVLVQLAKVHADPDFAIAFWGNHHGSTSIRGLVNVGYDA